MSFADIRPWPHDASIGHLVVRDVARTPSVRQIRELVRSAFADHPEMEALRTSALFPGARERFADAGFVEVDRLALLERDIDRIEPIATMRRRPTNCDDRIDVRRLGARHLADAERIDVAAFGGEWANDARSLADIQRATPRHRSRLGELDGRTAGFAITGLAGPTGYLQRLAVDPTARRHGLGRRLVDDSLAWLQRRGASTVLVNTGVDNEPAMALYESLGFHRRRDELVVMQLTR
ncbi:MAG: GNAT family N-acetyltransferase [Actinomycetota bacterium]